MPVTSLDFSLIGLQDQLASKYRKNINQDYRDLYIRVLMLLSDDGQRERLAAKSYISDLNQSVLLILFVDSYNLSKYRHLQPSVIRAFRLHFGLPVQITFACLSSDRDEDDYEDEDNYEPVQFDEDDCVNDDEDEDVLVEVDNQLYAYRPSAEAAGLNKDQKKAFYDLQSFLLKNTEEQLMHRVIGYAGTGKSWLLCAFVRYLKNNSCSYLVACPTNKAVKNLKRIGRESKLDLEIRTVSQLLGQQPELNTETGKEEFISNETDFFRNYQVIIVDEFSMVSADDFDELYSLANDYGVKLLFCGDQAQLPPINEDEPQVSKVDMPESILNEVIRYDGEIARVAEQIRINPRTPALETSEDGTIICLPQEDWMTKAVEFFDSDEFAENPDYVRFLAWRNATVKKLNAAVRQRLYGEDVLDYIPGDRLIALSPLFAINPGGKGKNKWKKHLNNSEEIIVCEQGTIREMDYDKERYKYWDVPARADAGKREFRLMILHDDSRLIYKKKIKEYCKEKSWSPYYELSKHFDNVGYAYGLTVHKAQGTTINNVFLDVGDMKHCKDKQKLLYTAVTRTKDTAYILS